MLKSRDAKSCAKNTVWKNSAAVDPQNVAAY